IYDEMLENGISITKGQVSLAMLFPGAAMIVGLLIALLITYRKDRISKDVKNITVQDVETKEYIMNQEDLTWKPAHTVTVVAIIAALILQLVSDSLVLGALAGIIVMFLGRVVHMYEGDKVVNEGIGMMGMIAFVMLVASGYANVLTESGAINELVEGTLRITGDSPFVIALLLLGVGLLITIGIGTSFGTIPILAALYAPVFIATGMSPLASAA